MSNPPSPAPGGNTPGLRPPPEPASGQYDGSKPEKAPQARDWRPIWLREMPNFRQFPQTPDEGYELISDKVLDELEKEPGITKEAVDRIRKDREFLNYELRRLFLERDHEAKLEQNRYRVYQISFIILATVATMIGSIQALLLANRPEWVPLAAFAETAVALITTFLATVRGNNPPLRSWLDNRRRAESMRREYFRYIMRLPPYHESDDERRKRYRLKVDLANRAAQINKGQFPTEDTVLEQPGGNGG